MTTIPPAAELPTNLEAAIGHIRAALLPGADAAARAMAFNVCHALARVFEAQPLGAAGPEPAAAPTPAAVVNPIDKVLARFLTLMGGHPATATPPTATAPAPALLDQVLERVAATFGRDLPSDPSIPYLNLGQSAAAMGLGRRR